MADTRRNTTTSLIDMMARAPRHPDFANAVEAYVAAAKALEKAHQAFEQADQVVQQREAELRSVYERLVGVTPEGGSDGS